MVPSHDEEVAAGYEYEPPMSMVKTFLGDPPEHVSAYEVRAPLISAFLLVIMSCTVAFQTTRGEA